MPESRIRHAPSVKQPTQSGRSLPSPEETSQELATPIDGSVRKHPASDRGSEFVAGRGSVDTLPDSRRSGGRAAPGTPCLRHRTSTPRGDPTSSRPSVCQSDPGPAPSLFVQDGIRRRCREGGSRGWRAVCLRGRKAVLHVMGERIASEKRRNPWTSQIDPSGWPQRARKAATQWTPPSPGRSCLRSENSNRWPPARATSVQS